MSKQEVIASQVVSIIKENKKPYYKIIFKKAGDVVIDLSKDTLFIYFIDIDHRTRNEFEKIRILQRIKRCG